MVLGIVSISIMKPRNYCIKTFAMTNGERYCLLLDKATLVERVEIEVERDGMLDPYWFAKIEQLIYIGAI